MQQPFHTWLAPRLRLLAQYVRHGGSLLQTRAAKLDKAARRLLLLLHAYLRRLMAQAASNLARLGPLLTESRVLLRRLMAQVASTVARLRPLLTESRVLLRRRSQAARTGLRTALAALTLWYATNAARLPRRNLHPASFRQRLRHWSRPRISIAITLPYLVLAMALGLTAVYLAARMEGETLSSAFQRQLIDASQRVADTSVRQEQAHLEGVRAIARFAGLPEALAAGERQTLVDMVLPYAANAGIDRVVLLDAQGRTQLAMRHSGGSATSYIYGAAADYAGWPIVQAVLQGQVDREGDKFIDIGVEDEQWVLYTAGPINARDQQVGVVLVGTSLQRLVQGWRDSTLADITLYSADGRPLVSTLAFSGLRTIGERQREMVSADTAVRPKREIALDSRRYSELLQPFVVRRSAEIGLIGVALPTIGLESRQQEMAALILQLFIGGSLAAVVIGLLLARRFVSRINLLVEASERVTNGDLSIRLQVAREDELGRLTSRFNTMVTGLRERERVRELFGRFVSPDIAELVLQRPLQLNGEMRMVTVLFTDIRDFTKMTEQQDPIDTVDTLNEYFEIIIEAAEQHHGLVNKFGGDSTLVLFGMSDDDASGQHSAAAAIKAALAIRERVIAWNARRAQRGLAPIVVGIGINTGEVVAGLVGAQKRMEYTVIGDAVNLSARIQALSHRIGGDILISEATYHALYNKERLQVCDLGDQQIRGKQNRVRLYAVMEWQSDAIPTSV